MDGADEIDLGQSLPAASSSISMTMYPQLFLKRLNLDPRLVRRAGILLACTMGVFFLGLYTVTAREGRPLSCGEGKVLLLYPQYNNKGLIEGHEYICGKEHRGCKKVGHNFVCSPFMRPGK